MDKSVSVSIEVRCIKQTHKSISHIGGPNGDGTSWKMTFEEAVGNIKADKFSFYINHKGNKTDIVLALSSAGKEYLKTTKDIDEPENLLMLPSCD